ncbi:hypothetical protein GGS20DRAFT_453363 [Poronia punctata]|nr:hypothetical protein GGS20DRAFT_453363 [Poronia punctata]
MLGILESSTCSDEKYPAVRYKYFCFSKTPKNRTEVEGYLQGFIPETLPEDGDQDGVLVLRRRLRPRKLCVIRESADAAGFDFDVVDSLEWDTKNPDSEQSEYVFVSYTRAQFCTYTRQEINSWDAPETDEDRMTRSFQESQCDADRRRLGKIGIQAARDAGVKAFWIDVYCMPDAESSKMEPHRICDVARGAKCMVIALQDTVQSRALHWPMQEMNNLLPSWSSRLWTLPEMLLAPTRYDLKIYHATKSVQVSDTIPKRNMAARAYLGRDATLVRQLVDHFEASQQLTLTELLTIGLECLIGRDKSEYMRADPVYALMTMVRRRPIPDKDESLFEAFAKLSLLNDSDSLLERLICTLPARRGEPWHKLEDFWGAKLWDIEPTVQVAAIASDESVVLDGAFGAMIEWKELNRVGYSKLDTTWRDLAELVLQSALWFFIYTTLLSLVWGTGVSGLPEGPFYLVVSAAVIFSLVVFLAVALLPALMVSLYSGKFLATEALLLGIEGQADLEWLEIQLFGFAQGRLQWSVCSTTQSLHRLKSKAGSAKWIDNEIKPLEPTTRPLDNANPEKTDPDRIFTIVDTYTMTASLIRAVHPPTTALICGQEGGMQRTLLCSYDYRTQTFHRETVMRMTTMVLNRMERIDKFRFSMANMPLRSRKNGVFGTRSRGARPAVGETVVNLLQYLT